MINEVGNELSEKIELLKKYCNEINAPLLHAGINGLLDVYHLELDDSDFFSLISHEKPISVFYEVVAYSPESFVRGVMIAHGWQEIWEKDRKSIWPTPSEIQQELSEDFKKIENQIGLPRSLMITYSIYGQHRMCWVTVGWAGELARKIGEITDSWFERAEEKENKSAKMFEALIADVASDPEFKAIRGRPKKLIFLQKKYGEIIPPHPRGQLSQPAQNCGYVDAHVAMVLIKADEKVWAEENLK